MVRVKAFLNMGLCTTLKLQTKGRTWEHSTSFQRPVLEYTSVHRPAPPFGSPSFQLVKLSRRPSVHRCPGGGILTRQHAYYFVCPGQGVRGYQNFI
ncbi:hypothetical protein E2C01_075863 [Portunus trituberculatus]|uniref:Uncharacterized protein n=1 Tax=Portunus trituberculatus TaxID=210409 RepID=A0A5B7IGW2_PORTR|nr:hypothetical protein [Portunus trituberculatus]